MSFGDRQREPLDAHDGDPEERAVMSFGDHLEELRRRIFLAVIPLIPIAIAVFWFADKVRFFLEGPLRRALIANGQPDSLQTLNAVEMMGVDIKLSIIAALVVSGPWVLWQLWKFIEPGLYQHERRFARLLVPGSALLVIAGLSMLQWLILPLMLEVLVQYGIQPRGAAPPALLEILPGGARSLPILTEPPKEVAPGQAWLKMPEHQLQFALPGSDGHAEVFSVPLSRDSAYVQQYRESEYVDFVLLLMLGIAIVFQMPLVILLLGWVGIVRPETLTKRRKLAVFILTIVAAAITPTSDVLSLLFLLVPMYGLYELGILLLRIAPPSAVAEGNVLRGFLSRVRGANSSGKRPARTAQSGRIVRASEAEPAPRSSHPSASEQPPESTDDRGTGSGAT